MTDRYAVFETQIMFTAIAIHRDLDRCRQRIGDRHADTMQTTGKFIGAA